MARVRSRLLRPTALHVAALVVLMAGYALAVRQVHGYETNLIRQKLTISGAVPTPVLRIVPAAPNGNVVAIIVHGYSGDKELMTGFGLALARIGIPSYLLDLPGHGASDVAFNPEPVDNRYPQAETALDAVVSYARTHSGVAQPRIVLIGHSLGTVVVGEYALHQPTTAIAATVLISPVLHDMPTPQQPANLQILYGEGDISAIIPLSRQLFTASCGAQMIGISHGPANNYQSCGTYGSGFERRLAVIPGANHITILTDSRTYLQIQWFIASALGVKTDYDPSTDDGRVAWALFGAVCGFGLLFPLIALLATGLPLANKAANDAAVTTQATWGKLALVAGGVAITVVLLRLWSWIADKVGAEGLRTPFTWLHMALADYVASFAFVLAVVVVVLHRLLRRPVPWPMPERWGWQLALAAAAGLALYLTIGTLSTTAWEGFLLNGPRSWRFVLIALAQLPLFAIFIGMFREERGWRGLLAFLGAFLLLCLGYVGAIILDDSLFFLSLLVPLEGLLFVAFALLARWLGRQGRQVDLASAVLMAGAFAWAVAAVFPVLP